ncbi:MAG: cell envelope integrity protein CreD [Flavobacteriales bacterium]|nr:cell envelope integrity protein CreD [Flavobacteriales bacterium]
MENQQPTPFEKFNQKIRNSITIRLMSITILVLLLLIPTSMIQSLISEREYRRGDVIREVSSKWGDSQTISGPVLTVPYYTLNKYYDNKEKIYKYSKTKHFAHFLPDDLTIAGDLNPEIRYRSIYEIIVYNTQLHLQGEFPAPDFKKLGVEPDHVIWEEAFVSFGIPDMKGIRDNINLKWGTQEVAFNPGIPTNDVIASGVSAKVDLLEAKTDSEEKTLRKNYPFAFDLNLNGSHYLNFIPVGKETNITLRSDWSHPSFTGASLPDEREIGPNGFTAHWKELHLNRNYPQEWLGNAHNIYNYSFGVDLLLPVDEYQKSMRSAKYAIMFISFTFLIFFFVEIRNKKRIHPIQFILVGLALTIFYALLVSLSEVIHFNLAYLISSTAIIIMISAYSFTIFKSGKLTALMSGVLVLLYGFIYTILQLEDHALLMGSIGLFIVLAVVMYLSRKIDWYGIAKGKQE